MSFPNGVGKAVGWAYPNPSSFDLTHELVDTLKNILGCYVRRYSAFEFNPARTKDMVQKEYDIDKAEAERIFECIKGVSKDNFYQPYPDKLTEAIVPNIKNKIHYKITEIRI